MKAHLAPRFASLFLTAAACPLALAAGAAAEKKPEPAKPYVLFMGADLDVQRDKKFHRVEDVVGSELKIRIGKKEFFVPTRNRNTGLKVSHSLKLSATAVRLDGLEAGPSYTPANDPKHKFNRESGAAGGAAAVQDLAYGSMIALNLNASQSAVNAEGATGPSAAMAQANVAAEQAAANARMQGAAAEGAAIQYSSQYNTGAYAEQMQRELADANYDAMEVSFKISSPVELDDPHMVILFKFQERDAKPGTEGMLIHAEALDPIGPKPKYIRIRKGGMPQGFKYLDCEVHIFNRGEEVATNASSKRVELTREEARQYLLIDHLGANKGANVPASAMAGSLPPDRLKALSPDQQERVFYAKVGADGTVLGLYADESCRVQLDDTGIREAIGEVFFKPALVKGKPVEGIAYVRLSEI